jgi:hypothetical protein
MGDTTLLPYLNILANELMIYQALSYHSIKVLIQLVFWKLVNIWLDEVLNTSLLGLITTLQSEINSVLVKLKLPKLSPWM